MIDPNWLVRFTFKTHDQNPLPSVGGVALVGAPMVEASERVQKCGQSVYCKQIVEQILANMLAGSRTVSAVDITALLSEKTNRVQLTVSTE